MYDIRQFRPTLYLLLLIGVSGFAMASQSPGLWLIATGGILLNWWLVSTGRFKPMPRLLANAVTVVAVVFVALEVRDAGDSGLILTIGEFLVLLHLIKLYEQRANRDYAQLLVLSLLLMVAASISTASLLFGLTLIGYLFISLYCCLLFHLKVENDQAKLAIGGPDRPIDTATLKHDQRYLPRSMRRLTGLVSTVALACAVVVFLFFPRGTGAGMFGQLTFRPAETLTGFRDQVGFQQVAKITQSSEIVAHVKVFEDDKLVQGTQPLLFRGLTLDHYSGNSPTEGHWQWSRSQGAGEGTYQLAQGVYNDPPFTGATAHFRQEVMLQPTGTSVIFAIAGAERIMVNRDMQVRYARRDGALSSGDRLVSPLQYTVESTGEIPPPPPPPDPAARGGDRSDLLATRPSVIDPKIPAFARRPEVSGTAPDGRLLADVRGTRPGPTQYDETIARNIETYLRTNFTYTLDLTDAQRIEGQDPMVAFLYDLKRGHCEYFAGAMTLMCQSLGMQARMAVGFRCDEYNGVGGYYIVRQSHAHTWVEVLTSKGWETFDPTSSREDDTVIARNGIWTDMKHFFDYLNYKWGASVVAYDRGNRQNLIEAMNNKLTNVAINGTNPQSWPPIGEWWEGAQRSVYYSLIAVLMGAMVLAAIVLIGWFSFERWRLRQRAKRIGLSALPVSDQERLARQLGFYDDLLRVLERRQIVRPPQLTPLEFSQTLAFLPNELFDQIRRLTAIYYRIRYGGVELNPHRQRHLDNVIDQMESVMPASIGGAK